LLATSGRAVVARLNGAAGLLLLLSLAHAVTHAFGGLMPLVFPMVATQFKLTYTDIGLLVGFTQFAGGMLQVVYGVLGQHFLRKTLLAAGQVIIGLSCIVTGLANGFAMLFMGNLGARIGSSPQHPMGNSLLSDRFPAAQRGSALSLHVVGGNIGTVIVPVLGAVLLATVGWRATLFLLAVPAFALSLALTTFIEEHKGETRERRASALPTGQVLRQILSSRTIVLIMLASIIGAAGRGLGALNTYLPLYLNRDLGISTNVINALYTCLLLGGVAGPFLLGRLSDQLGRRLVLYLTYAGATILLLLFVGMGAAPALALGGVLLMQGIFSHSDIVILTTYLADVATPEQRDMAFSVLFTVAFGVGSLWPTVLGVIADHLGLAGAFVAMAAAYAAAGLCLLPIRDKK
jgi:FSR family fosmidomycin resistance protein-like MFS transporter